MKFKLKAAFVLLLLLVSAVPLLFTLTQDAQAASTLLYVGPSSTYQNIQSAINASGDYGVIYVDNGTYYENLNFVGLSGFNSLTIKGNGSVIINGMSGFCFVLNGSKLTELNLYNMSLESTTSRITASSGCQVNLYGVQCANISVDGNSLVHVYNWVEICVYYHDTSDYVQGADIKWCENGITRYQTSHYLNASPSPKTNVNGTLGPWAMKRLDYLYSSSPTYATNEIWIFKECDISVEIYKVVYANDSHMEFLHLSKDIIAPPQVTGLKVTAVSQTDLNVSWGPSTALDLFYYFLYSNATGSWEAKANVSLTWYLDGGYSPGQTVYYAVAAFDQAGLPSVLSDYAFGTTLVPISGSVECKMEFENATEYPTLNYSATVSIIDGTGGSLDSQILYGSKINTTLAGLPLETTFTVHVDPSPLFLGEVGTASGWLPFVSSNFTLTIGYPSVTQDVILARYDLITAPTAYIEGVVTYKGGPENGTAAEGAEVRLLDNIGSVLSTLWTDNYGDFYFEDVPINKTYSIEILPPTALAWKNGTDGYLVTHVKKFLLTGDQSLDCSMVFSGSAKVPLVLRMRKPMGDNIPLNALIQVQFNHPIDLTPFSARFNIMPSVDNLTFDQTNDTTFHISHDLFESDTTYTITIGETLLARNNAGFAFGYSNRSWTFTTGNVIVQKDLTISRPLEGEQFKPDEMISVSGSTTGIAPDTVIIVEMDGVQQTCNVKTDGSWAVNIKAPSDEGTFKITVTSGTITEEVTIKVVDNGGSTEGGLSGIAWICLIVIILVVVSVIVLIIRSRRRAAMSNTPPSAQPQPTPAPARAKTTATAAPPAKATASAPKAAPVPPKTKPAPVAQPKPAKPSAASQSKPAKGHPAPAAPKAPAPPMEPEMPEPPMVPPEISMDDVFEDVPEVAEPEAPEETEFAEEKIEDVKEEELAGERRPLTPDQQRMYKRAQGLERALNFDRAALMYEDLEMWDDARRCRQAKTKEDASGIDLNVYKRGRPQTKGDFDEYGQLKTPALFPCPECGSLISSEPCKKCGWKGGKDDITKEMLEKKM